MMNSGTIKIGKKEYPYVFNMKARRLFMQRFKLVSFQEYFDKLQTLESAEKEITLEHIDVIGNLVITAIESALKEQCGLDADEVWDHFEQNEGALPAFMESFSAAQEQQEPQKKSNTRSSAGKSKRGK